MGDNDAKVFLLVLSFLMFWTGFVGIVNMASSEQITLSTIGAVLGSPASQSALPGQMVLNPNDNSAANSLLTNQNYTPGEYDPNLTHSQMGWLTNYGKWEVTANGYELIDPEPGIFNQRPVLWMDGILPDSNGVYTVNYLINNIPDTEFSLYPRFNKITPALSLRIAIEPDGIHFYDTEVQRAFVPASGYQTTTPGTGSIYMTQFDSKNGILYVQKDGGAVYSCSGMFLVDNKGLFFGAVGSRDAGFAVRSTDAIRTSGTGGSGQESPWGWAVKLIENTIPGATAVIQMLSILAAAVGLTSQPVVPFAVWAALGIPSIITLMYLGAKLARGS